MYKNLREIIKIILFIKDMTMIDLKPKISISYTSVRNFLIYRRRMTMAHLEEVFKALDFPFVIALKLAEQDLSRIELMKKILQEVKND